MTCKKCRFLDVAPDALGRRKPRRDKMYRCTAPVEEPSLPQSVTKAYGYKWPPSRKFMGPDDGDGCPSFNS
jgi:hypothetical protein